MQQARVVKANSREWLEYKGLQVDEPVLVKVDLRKLVQVKKQLESVKADLARAEFQRLFR